MPIPAENLIQLTASYSFTPTLALVTADLSNFVVTVDPALNRVLAIAHGLVNGTPIQFSNSGGGLPGGIVADTTYFVVNVAADYFQISEAIAGIPIDILSVGSGTHTVSEQDLGTGRESGDLVNSYEDGGMEWDLMVRHQVASYEGSGRQQWTWNTAEIDDTGVAVIPTSNVAIIPVSNPIDFKYAVVLRGANLTRGDSTGSVAFIDEYDLTISLQGTTFSFGVTTPNV